jgi:Putative MetA-pathway of phenol degradation
LKAKSIVIYCILLLKINGAAAQSELNELTVDRPGIAEAPFTVSPGMYQFEMGFDYFNRYDGELYHLPNLLFRTGLSKKAELRISSKQVLDKTESNAFKGISPVTVGIKTHIIKQNEWIPEIDILANVVIPVRSSSQSNIGPEFILLFENDFYPNTAINYNIGYLWDSNRGKNIFTASFCFNYLPTERVGLFIEYFDYLPNRWPGEQGIDGGMTYLLKSKLQFDISAGVSRLTKENNIFVSSGLSLRIEQQND